MTVESSSFPVRMGVSSLYDIEGMYALGFRAGTAYAKVFGIAKVTISTLAFYDTPSGASIQAPQQQSLTFKRLAKPVEECAHGKRRAIDERRSGSGNWLWMGFLTNADVYEQLYDRFKGRLKIIMIWIVAAEFLGLTRPRRL